MFIDYVILTFAVFGLDSLINNLNFISSPELAVDIWFTLSLFLTLNKDFFNGRSIAKRILSIQILDAKSGKTASELQCVIRNMFVFIGPIEGLVAYSKPEKRIGDLLANTKVVLIKNQDNTKADKSKLNKFIALFLSLGYSLMVNYLFGLII